MASTASAALLPPPIWAVKSSQAWVGASSRLRIPVPCTTGKGRFLSVDFQVEGGGIFLQSVDFDVMFENEEGAPQRLYGPTRRTTGVQTTLRVPTTGVAYVTFDNSSAWASSALLSYTLLLTADEPSDSRTISKLILGRSLVTRTPTQAETTAEDDLEAEVEEALASAPREQLRLAPGTIETATRDVAAGTRLVVSIEVVQGALSKYDVDFGIMLLPGGDERAEPVRLFGPCRRVTALATSVCVPCDGRAVLSFDNSAMWVSSKQLSYTLTTAEDVEM